MQKVITGLMEENTFINSCEMVQSEIKALLGIDVTIPFVRGQMQVLGLKYKKVKHISK